MFFHRDYSPEEKNPFANSLARYRDKKERKKKNKIAGARFSGLLDNRGNKQSAPITFELFLRSSGKTRYSRILDPEKLTISEQRRSWFIFLLDTNFFSVVEEVPNRTEILL